MKKGVEKIEQKRTQYIKLYCDNLDVVIYYDGEDMRPHVIIGDDEAYIPADMIKGFISGIMEPDFSDAKQSLVEMNDAHVATLKKKNAEILQLQAQVVKLQFDIGAKNEQIGKSIQNDRIIKKQKEEIERQHKVIGKHMEEIEDMKISRTIGGISSGDFTIDMNGAGDFYVSCVGKEVLARSQGEVNEALRELYFRTDGKKQENPIEDKRSCVNCSKMFHLCNGNLNVVSYDDCWSGKGLD